MTETLAWLAAQYPATFGADMKPLMIGAGREIWPVAKAGGTKRQELNDAMKWRTRSLAYLDALGVEGAMRHSPEGRAIEPVSDEHRAGAIAARAEITRIRDEQTRAALAQRALARARITSNHGGN
jgi:ProQ/FINO family